MPKKLSKKQVRFRRILASAALVIAILAVIFFYLIITQSGHWLVEDDEFEHATWVAVLDGQSADMERIDYAADLLTNGKVDSVLILGRRCLRTRNNSEFYADEFMQQGNFDSNAVFLVSHNDPSTITEAFTLIPWLKKHKADTVLLLTYAPATYRVKRIFEVLSGDSPVYKTVDIHHYQYNADSWYTNRESRKNWLREWAALAISYVDLWGVEPLTVADSTYYKPIVTIKDFEAQKNPVVDLQSLLPTVQKKIEETVSDTSATASSDSTATSTADTTSVQTK
ncbi:MAG: YdcF family protein [Fibrobacter sp.]|nr:YdcF family protein [Fibrobacter sp.]